MAKADKGEKKSPGYQRRRGFAYGIILVGLGIAFLTQRIRIFDLWDMWMWAAYAAMAFGVAKIIVWESASEVGSGVVTGLAGVVWLAILEGWYGLELETGWPLFLVVIGVGMIAKVVLRPLFRRGLEPAATDGKTSSQTGTGSASDVGGKWHA